MRFEALLLVLACQSIRAEVVDYGEFSPPGQEKIILATEKACFPDISKNCGKSCYRQINHFEIFAKPFIFGGKVSFHISDLCIGPPQSTGPQLENVQKLV